MRFIENIKITKENQNDFVNVSVIFGYIDIQKGVNFTAPFLRRLDYVYIQEEATFVAPFLEEISGFVDIQKGATFDAPVLTSIAGCIFIHEKTTFNVPILLRILGNIYICENTTFVALSLTKCGSVNLRFNATYITPVLTEVSGDVYIEDGATFIAPILGKVAGCVDIQKRGTFNAIVLADFFFKVGYNILKGYLTQTEGNFPEGIYLNLTEKEKKYIKLLKPLLKNDRIMIFKWEGSSNWKKQKDNQIFKGSNTSYSISEWLQIFDFDKNNGKENEEIGKVLALNLNFFIYESKKNIEKVINTFLFRNKSIKKKL